MKWSRQPLTIFVKSIVKLRSINGENRINYVCILCVGTRRTTFFASTTVTCKARHRSDSDRIFRIWNFPTIFRSAPIFSESIVEPIWTEPPLFRKGRVRSVDTDYKLSNRLEATLKFGHHGDSNPRPTAYESVPLPSEPSAHTQKYWDSTVHPSLTADVR